MILTASNRHRHVGLGLTGFIALWGVVSVIATSLQCGSTYPWRTGNPERDCIDFVSSVPINRVLRTWLNLNADCFLARRGCRQYVD